LERIASTVGTPGEVEIRNAGSKEFDAEVSMLNDLSAMVSASRRTPF
jgi:hypothetical protein